jgi:hypothetical protein
MRRISTVVLLALAIAALSANAVGAASNGDRVGSKYLDALITDVEGRTHDKAVELAVAESMAAEYAKEQVAFGPVGRPPGATRKLLAKGGYKICGATSDSCATYTGFRTRKGKLVSFVVNGKRLDQRLRVLSQSATDGPLTFSPRWAYVTAADKLALVVDVRNDGDRPLLPTAYASVWVDPSGRQQMNRLASVAEAAPEVNAHATGTMLLSFDDPQAAIGGRVILKAYDNNPPSGEPQAHYQVDIPIG